MLGRQLLDEARRHARRPLIVDPAVGGEADGQPPPGAGHADIGQPALLLERLGAALVDGALVREQRPPPSRRRNTLSNSRPLAPCSVMMLTMSASGAAAFSITRLTCSRKRRQRVELLHRLDQLLQVLEPARARRACARPATSRCSPTRRARSRRARAAACVAQLRAPAVEVAQQLGAARCAPGPAARRSWHMRARRLRPG